MAVRSGPPAAPHLALCQAGRRRGHHVHGHHGLPCRGPAPLCLRRADEAGSDARREPCAPHARVRPAPRHHQGHEPQPRALGAGQFVVSLLWPPVPDRRRHQGDRRRVRGVWRLAAVPVGRALVQDHSRRRAPLQRARAVGVLAEHPQPPRRPLGDRSAARGGEPGPARRVRCGVRAAGGLSPHTRALDSQGRAGAPADHHGDGGRVLRRHRRLARRLHGRDAEGLPRHGPGLRPLHAVVRHGAAVCEGRA